MSDFPINIKVDPGDSKSKIDDIGRTVDKAEKQASAATKAFKSLGEAVQYMVGQTLTSATKAFGSLADAIGYKLNTQITQAVRGFNSMADAMQRERAMLVTIRGDTEAYAKDVQVLNSLMDRGKISAQEYDAALASAGQRHGLADMKPEGGGFLDGAVGQLAAIAGPAAIAGKALSAIGDGFEEIRQKQQALSEASVSMLRYKDSVESARESTEGLQGTSRVLGADIKETVGTFLSVADATSKLGKSEEQVSAITRNLGLIMKTDGKSLSDVGGVLERLQFAYEKNKLEAGEFETIMRRFPPLAQAWEREFGKTQEQLLKLAEAGKLTREEIARMFTTFENANPDSLRKRQQQLVAEFLGKDVRAQARDAFAFHDAMVDLEEQATKAGVALDYTIYGGLYKLPPELRKAQQAADEAARALSGVKNETLSLAEDPWADKRNLMIRGLDAIRDRAQAAARRLAQVRTFFGDIRDTALAAHLAGLEGGKRKAEAADNELKTFAVEDEIGLHSSQARETQVRSQTDFAAIDAGWTKAVTSTMLADVAAKQYFDDLHTRQKKYAAELESQEDGIARGFNAIEKELRDIAGLTEKTLVGWYNGLEDAMVDAFRTGKFEFSSMIDSMMADLTRLAIRQAALGLIGLFGPGGTPSVFGTGATQAFEGLYGGSAGLNLKVPHFASGGGMRVPGTGATDTTPVTFFATGGEELSIRTPGQQMTQRQSAPQAAQSQVLQVIAHIDDRALLRVLQSPGGATVLSEVMRKNPGLLKR